MFNNETYQQFATLYKSCYIPILHSYHPVIAQNNDSKEFVTALLIDLNGVEMWVQTDQVKPC